MKKFLYILLFVILNIYILNSQVYKDPNAAVEDRVEDLLSRMTLQEKIGQMTQGNMTSVSASDVQNYFLGSVLSGGGAVPGQNTPAGWADLYDSYQNAAVSTRLGIPIIYGIDAVHGHNNVRDAVIFPHNIGLGAANDPDLMERIGSVTASEVAATGIDWTFAPCVAVARNERWGRTYESYSEDPVIHENLTSFLIEGLQGENAYMQDEKIVACAKHWIGDGGTTDGIDQGNTEISEAELRAIHLPPYLKAIEAEVGTVMISYNSWNGDRMSGHYYLITDVLKNELGFNGFIVSDWNSIRALPGDYRNQIKLSINAGLDMMMAPYQDDWKPFITNLTDLVNSGEVSMSRIDDAVRRILRVKFKAGLFEKIYTDRSLASSFGSQAHRDVAREAVRKSLVLLKNENNVLPVSKNAKIFIAGTAADSLRKQCGGWTIGWQGMTSDYDTTGTTILDALYSVSSSITFSEYGYGISDHDVALVVVGEDPYAEGSGDSTDLSLSQTDINIINTVKNSGVPYVVILISGRPMIITDEIQEADGFIAAWLPGTEGQGVVDVIFGDYNFTGKLPMTWPKNMAQIPINLGDSSYDPLFAFGYGLSYNTNDNEAPTIPLNLSASNISTDSITLNWQASTDNIGVTGYNIYKDGIKIPEQVNTTSQILSNLNQDTEYTFEITAYDAAGNESLKSTALIVKTLKQNISPTVTITSPVSNLDILEGSDILIEADAADSDGTVIQVQFFSGSTLIDTDDTAPYSVLWADVQAGSHDLTAVAIDNDNASTTSAIVNVWVFSNSNNPPTVSLTSPSNGATYTEGDNITISAEASDSDGTVTLVEFYAGSTKIGEDSTSPYSITWSSAVQGDYAITAVATDNDNDSATSQAVNITVIDGGNNDYVDITVPFVEDGSGEFYWKTTTTPNYINSWNLQLLEINGVDLTNTWKSGSQLPAKQDGYYYIHYVGSFPWSHFEAK